MDREKPIYPIIAVAVLLTIYISSWFIDYSVFQGYVISGCILCLGIFNCFFIRKSDQEYPTFGIAVGSWNLKVQNYRLLFIGMLCLLIGFVYWLKNISNPFAYLMFSTGLFAAAYSRLIFKKKAKEPSR